MQQNVLMPFKVYQPMTSIYDASSVAINQLYAMISVKIFEPINGISVLNGYRRNQ